jgi:integrase
MDIENICNLLLEALAEAGFSESTLFNYRGVIRRFKSFCNERGASEYTPEIGQAYADDVISRKTGKFSKQRYFSQGRFARLLNSYYLTGSFDMSVMKRGRQEPDNENLNRLYQEYIAYLNARYSNDNTISFYGYEVLCLFRYLESIGIYGIHDVITTTIVGYLKTTKQSRQRAVLCGLRLYFTFIDRDDLFAVVDGMHAYRSKRIIPVLTDDEVSRLQETIVSGSITNRDAAIILLGLSTGIRAIDLINLKLSSIDWNNETISFKQSKTGNHVCIPLTLAVGNAIARYLCEERPDADNDYLFVRNLAPFDPLGGHSSCYVIVRKAFEKAGISKDARIFGMHMLRHNAASAMVRNEVPVSTIAAVLGHASTDTTDIYITTDAVRLRECVLPMTGISKEVNA